MRTRLELKKQRPLTDERAQMIADAMNETAPFAKMTATDVKRLTPVDICPHCASDSQRVYAVRCGAWIVVAKCYFGENDYVLANKSELP